MPNDFTNPDWTLGYRPPRVGISTAPWAPQILPELMPPSATDIQSRAFADTQRKPDVATPAAQTLATTRRGEPYDKPYPAPRIKMLPNPLRNDEYLSDGDRRYASLHDILRTDCYPGSESESDAVFSGGGISRAPYATQDQAVFDGNLHEFCDELTEAIANGVYGNDGTFLAEDGNDGDALKNAATAVLELSETWGGLSPLDCAWAMHIVLEHHHTHEDKTSLSDFMEKFQSATRDQRLAQIEEMLSTIREKVSANKVSQGLSGTDSSKPKKNKTTDGISNGTVARAVAVAASGIGAKKKKTTSGVVGNGIMGESVVREVSPRLARLLKG